MRAISTATATPGMNAWSERVSEQLTRERLTHFPWASRQVPRVGGFGGQEVDEVVLRLGATAPWLPG